MKTIFTSVLLLVFFFSHVAAQSNERGTKRNSNNQIQSNCNASTSTVDLDIGNVRAKILMNGDMWWDLIGNAQYEVPKNSGKYSLFAGALWIGGLDASGNLKLAAQTYRQSGCDFWPGPLDTTNASITASVCTQYDRHWKVTRQEVTAFVDSLMPGHNPIIPSADIQQWPGNGSSGSNQAPYLAPYHDSNGDGIYDWQDGDYPGYDLSSVNSCDHCGQ